MAFLRFPITIPAAYSADCSVLVTPGLGDTNPANAADLVNGFTAIRVTIPAGSTSANADFAIAADATVEPNEQVKATLSAPLPSGATIASDASVGVGIISNDDVAPPAPGTVNYGTLNSGQSTATRQVPERPQGAEILCMQAQYGEQQFFVWVGKPDDVHYKGVQLTVRPGGFIRVTGAEYTDGTISPSAFVNVTVTPTITADTVLGVEITEDEFLNIYERVNGEKNYLKSFGGPDNPQQVADLSPMFDGGNGLSVQNVADPILQVTTGYFG